MEHTRKGCQWLGGNLVSITSPEESHYIQTITNSEDHWIGGIYKSGEWGWIDKNPFIYKNWEGWKPGNPVKGNERIYLSKDGKWNNANISSEMSGIYKREVSTTPSYPT